MCSRVSCSYNCVYFTFAYIKTKPAINLETDFFFRDAKMSIKSCLELKAKICMMMGNNIYSVEHF